MTARERYEAGLRAGYIDESNPDRACGPDGDPADPYWAGVRDGRQWWRHAIAAAMVVDRPPIGGFA